MVPQIGNRYPVFYDAQEPSDFIFVNSVDDATGRANIVAMFGDAFGPDASGVGMPAIAAPAAAPVAEDPLDRIKKLAELRDAGALHRGRVRGPEGPDPRDAGGVLALERCHAARPTRRGTS